MTDASTSFAYSALKNIIGKNGFPTVENLEKIFLLFQFVDNVLLVHRKKFALLLALKITLNDVNSCEWSIQILFIFDVQSMEEKEVRYGFKAKNTVTFFVELSLDLYLERQILNLILLKIGVKNTKKTQTYATAH